MSDRLHTDLASLLSDPASVPIEQIPAAIGELERIKATLWARLADSPPSANGNGEDRLLAVDEAAERLSVTRDLLRRQKALPFRVEVSPGQLRYSAQGIERFIARRAGK